MIFLLFFVILGLKSVIYTTFHHFLPQLSDYSIISRFSLVFLCSSRRHLGAACGYCLRLATAFGCHHYDVCVYLYESDSDKQSKSNHKQ